mgnify:CR=1 FL=1
MFSLSGLSCLFGSFGLSGEKMSLTGLKVLIYFGNYPGGLE